VSIERWKLGLAVLVTLGLLALSVPWGADLGWAYLADRQYALAERMFARALDGDRGDADLWLGLAAAYAALGDPDRQIATLEAATREAPRRRDVRLQLADVYRDNKNPAAAARVLEELTAEPHPDDGPLLAIACSPATSGWATTSGSSACCASSSRSSPPISRS